MTTTTEPGLYASSYAEMGWRVIPLHSVVAGRCSCGAECDSPGKHPRTPNGLKNASTDDATIADWWRRWPEANIGIVTGRASGIVAIDIDPRHGGDESLAELEAEHGELPDTIEAHTGGGGRHFIFVHPGVDVPNRADLLPGIDVRGDGGYVVASPSNHITGGCYRWRDGHGFRDIEPAPLPDWLLAKLTEPKVAPRAANTTDSASGRLLQDAARYVAAAAGAPEGKRNNAAFNLAGHLAAFVTDDGETLSEGQILELMRGWNIRNVPPMSEKELAAVVHSGTVNGKPRPPHEVRTSAPSMPTAPGKFTGTAPGPASPEPIIRPSFVQATNLIADHPELREPIIEGLLRRGEILNCIAPPKLKKSWFVLGMLLCVAAGRPWLGFRTHRGRVLLLDNELHRETLAKRIPRVMEALDIAPADIEGRFAIESLRGRLVDLYQLGGYFNAIEPGAFDLVALDAWYRFMPKDSDENSNAQICAAYSTLDTYAARLGASFVVVHHSSKGNQSGKSITDMGAGAGSQARAADCHMALREHEQDDCVVLDAAVRSWAPLVPMCLRWTFPVWEIAPDLDPNDLRKPASRRAKRQEPAEPAEPPPPPWTVTRFASEILTEKPEPRPAIIVAAVNAGISERRAGELLSQAEAVGLAFRSTSPGDKRKALFSNTPKQGA